MVHGFCPEFPLCVYFYFFLKKYVNNLLNPSFQQLIKVTTIDKEKGQHGSLFFKKKEKKIDSSSRANMVMHVLRLWQGWR